MVAFLQVASLKDRVPGEVVGLESFILTGDVSPRELQDTGRLMEDVLDSLARRVPLREAANSRHGVSASG